MVFNSPLIFEESFCKFQQILWSFDWTYCMKFINKKVRKRNFPIQEKWENKTVRYQLSLTAMTALHDSAVSRSHGKVHPLLHQHNFSFRFLASSAWSLENVDVVKAPWKAFVFFFCEKLGKGEVFCRYRLRARQLYVVGGMQTSIFFLFFCEYGVQRKV